MDPIQGNTGNHFRKTVAVKEMGASCEKMMELHGITMNSTHHLKAFVGFS